MMRVPCALKCFKIKQSFHTPVCSHPDQLKLRSILSDCRVGQVAIYFGLGLRRSFCSHISQRLQTPSAGAMLLVSHYG